MRKNKFFIAGLVTVFVALVSLTLVSSTWAKYTSTASGSDNARVAYWGFGESTELSIDDLFTDVYAVGVDSADGEDVVAPGTTGSETFKFAFTAGQDDIAAPEVDYTLKLEATGSCPADLDARLVWKLDGVACTNFADLLAKLNALDGDETYEAGELPEAFGVDKEHTISWEWAFSVNEDGDVDDTTLGNANALAEVEINIQVTATQTQK